MVHLNKLFFQNELKKILFLHKNKKVFNNQKTSLETNKIRTHKSLCLDLKWKKKNIHETFSISEENLVFLDVCPLIEKSGHK